MEDKELIQEIAVINLKLQTIHHELSKKNKNGRQFDYVTSSSLSENVDFLYRWSERINNVVYQKK